jgi:hypothetical protein
MQKEILSASKKGCIALAPCGAWHLCYGQLYLCINKDAAIRFCSFLHNIKMEMEVTHGLNKIFIETGIPTMKIALNAIEVEECLDLLNEAFLTISMRDLLGNSSESI